MIYKDLGETDAELNAVAKNLIINENIRIREICPPDRANGGVLLCNDRDFADNFFIR